MAAKPAPDNPFDTLRRAREASGESVDDLAARAGVDPGWLAGVEDGAAPDDEEKLGLVGNALSIDLSKIFAPRRRRPASRTRAATSSSMDTAVRKAVKAEVEPLAKKVRTLSEEVAALERALREVAKVAAAAAKASKAPAKPAKPAAKRPAAKKPAAKARR